MGLFQGIHLVVEHVDAVGGKNGDFPIVHIDHVPGMLENGGYVRSDKIPLRAESQDQRAVLPGGDQGVGVIGADDAERISPFNPPQAPSHSLHHIAAFLIMVFQELGHDFGIGVGGKRNAVFHQLFFDFQIVFNNPIMNQGDLAVFAHMGMGVCVVGFSVGSPAGVSNAQDALQIRAAVGQFRERLQTALGFAHLNSLGLRARAIPAES